MNKKIVRLTEEDLHNIIWESVVTILKEGNYELPSGGFDYNAYKYDQALKNAKDEKEWDKMKAERDNMSDIGARVAMQRHPQTGDMTHAYKYTDPEYFDIPKDKILKDLEDTAESSKKSHGFSF